MVYLCVFPDCVDQLEWHRRYCVLEKDERTLYFYNDTEVMYNIILQRVTTCVHTQAVYMRKCINHNVVIFG